MVELTPTPAAWIDPEPILEMRRRSLEERVHHYTDRQITDALAELTIVSFDPGETTGWSVMRITAGALYDRRVPVQEALHFWTHGQVDTGSQMQVVSDEVLLSGEPAGVRLLEQIVDAQFPSSLVPRGVAVVFEGFILRTQNKKPEALSPVRVMARLEQLLWEADNVTIRKQQPGQAKGTVTDDRLKNWGMHVGGHAERHARDADRHALYFLRDMRSKPTLIKTAFPVVAEALERGLL